MDTLESPLTRVGLQRKFNYDVLTSELIVAVGGYSPNNEKAELLDVDENNWSSADDFPSDWGLT